MEPPSRIRMNRFTLNRNGKPLKSASIKKKEKQKRLMKRADKKQRKLKVIRKKRKAARIASNKRRYFLSGLQGSGYDLPAWVDVDDLSGRRHGKNLNRRSKNSTRGIKRGRRSVALRKNDPLKRKGGKSWKQNNKFGGFIIDFKLVL